MFWLLRPATTPERATATTPSAARPVIEASLVVTVLNEAGSIEELLAALAAQTVWPREIIIVDGGSTDGTPTLVGAWADRLPLRLLEAPGASISVGRNRGIAVASHEVVAVTDAGARPAPGWLAAITARLLAPETDALAADVVSGWFVADPRSGFEEAMGVTVLPTLNEIEPAAFLPSSRSLAVRKTAWAAVGGYPAWLDYGEDLVFDLRLRARGYRFAFVPAALVHFRPRPTLGAFWHQYFRYARGDGRAGLWPRRHLVRYATYGGALLLLALAGRRGRPGLALASLLLLVGAVAHLWRPYARLLPRLPRLGWRSGLQAAALVPLIRLTGDLAKMAGYPVGLCWRYRHHGPGQTWRTIDDAPPGKR